MSTWASQAKAETVERAKGRATTKRNLKLEQTPEERAAHPEPLLDKAENELAEYCSTLDSEEGEQCWLAYDYFESRKEDVEAGCEVDWASGSRSGADCEKLESFESFIREIGGSSPMSSFAHMLFRLRKRDMKVPTDGGEEAEIAKVEEPGGGTRYELRGVPESGKARLEALFQAMDKDGNGFLDTGEFRDAMQKLGMSNITGTTVSTILTAMDIHGPITMEEFLQIVDAEEINSDTPVSRWLRAHRGESKFWGNPIETI